MKGGNSKGSFAFFMLAGAFMASVSGSEAYTFYVGGKEGWIPNPPLNYNEWAGENRFQVNDTLVFKYVQGKDSVLLVSESAYTTCNSTNPIKTIGSSFTFDRSGPFYFISGVPSNCEANEKIIVVVLAIRKAASPPPPQPSPASTVPTPSAPPKPSTSPLPSPKRSPASPPKPSTSPSHSPSRSPASPPKPSTSPSPSRSPALPPSSSIPPSPVSPSSYPTSPPTPGTSPSSLPPFSPGVSPALGPTPPPAPSKNSATSVAGSVSVWLSAAALMILLL